LPAYPISDELIDEAIDLVAKHGSQVAAAKASGIPRGTIQGRIRSAEVRKMRAARRPATIVPLAPPPEVRLAQIHDTLSDRKHMVIPDTQCKPGVPLDHMRWAGLYACVKKPTVIVNLGDHWDMPSLCSYDKGKRSAENQTYENDILAGNKGMELFMEPIVEEMERCLERGEPWDPELHFIYGNHEARIERAVEDQPALFGTLNYDRFALQDWIQHPFLEVALVDGVAYSHYFTSGTMGRPVTTARALLTKKHQTCVMGHVQRYESAMDYNAEGKRITGLFAGCYYQHEDGYRDKQSNVATWRGVHVLYGVRDGEFTHNSIDLSYLRDRFSHL
jgi:hypothetical protein